jgi:branched-chain amino acid transport system ATP-binding protein
VTRGSIAYRGLELRGLANTKLLAAGVAFVPQGRCNFARMTVEENLEMGAFTLSRHEVPGALDKAYERFPILGEKRKQAAGLLSGGQQQILEMAMGLIVEPTLLLIDEPSLGLAPMTLASVLDQVQAIRDSGVTVVMVEQNARQALERSDRGIVLELGRTVMEGSGPQLLANPQLGQLYLGGNAVDTDPEIDGSTR